MSWVRGKQGSFAKVACLGVIVVPPRYGGVKWDQKGEYGQSTSHDPIGYS